jgi:hypothetical protein
MRRCCSLLKRTLGLPCPLMQACRSASKSACSCANYTKSEGDQAGVSGCVVVPAVAKCDGSRGSLGGLVSGHSIKVPQYWFNSSGLGISSCILVGSISSTSIGTGGLRGSVWVVC